MGSPTSSTPSSSPDPRKMKPSELFNCSDSLVNTPIPQMVNLSLQAGKAHSPEGEVMRFQPLTPETNTTDKLEVRPVTPTVKASCLEELEGLTDRVETPAMKAHSLESQTLQTKVKTEKKKCKKSKKSKIDTTA